MFDLPLGNLLNFIMPSFSPDLTGSKVFWITGNVIGNLQNTERDFLEGFSATIVFFFVKSV